MISNDIHNRFPIDHFTIFCELGTAMVSPRIFWTHQIRRPCRKQCLHLHCKGPLWLEKSLVRWLQEFKSWNGRVKAACSRLQDVFQVFVFLICINLYDSWIFCFCFLSMKYNLQGQTYSLETTYSNIYF